jgi:hypothetical protein
MLPTGSFVVRMTEADRQQVLNTELHAWRIPAAYLEGDALRNQTDSFSYSSKPIKTLITASKPIRTLMATHRQTEGQTRLL